MPFAHKIAAIKTNVKHYLYTPPDLNKVKMTNFIKDNFKYKHILGQGSFGCVLHAEYMTDNTVSNYAVKCIPKTLCTDVNRIVEEVTILKILAHNFIIKLEGTFQTSNLLCIVTETLLHGDLYTLIYENIDMPAIPDDLILFYLSSVVIVLDHIHSKGIIYRDLKPENIMLDSTGYIRVIDMGLAKRIRYINECTQNNEVTCQIVDEKTYTLCGSAEYLSPEILLKNGHDKSVDIWALGVLLYELFTKKTPFQATNIRKLFKNILDVKTKKLTLTQNEKETIANENVEKLLIELLDGTPSNRIGVKDRTNNILNHELFNNNKDMIDGIRNRTYIPCYIPTQLDDSQYDDLSNVPSIIPYIGDNSIFFNF